MVYVHYGRKEDFDLLASMGANLTGKIALARYGGNFRGIKAMLAQRAGCAGLIIYSDPADDGFLRGAVHPEGPFRPPDAVQRGSTQFISLYSGDPLTPGVAARPGVTPVFSPETAPTLSRIPILPVSFNDARPFLCALQGISARDVGWQRGEIDPRLCEYHLGVGNDSVAAEPPVVANLTVAMNNTRTLIWNVIGRFPVS